MDSGITQSSRSPSRFLSLLLLIHYRTTRLSITRLLSNIPFVGNRRSSSRRHPREISLCQWYNDCPASSSQRCRPCSISRTSLHGSIGKSLENAISHSSVEHLWSHRQPVIGDRQAEKYSLGNWLFFFFFYLNIDRIGEGEREKRSIFQVK